MPAAETSWLPFWQFATRLGEAQILLPALALATLMLLWQRQGRPLAVWWLALLAAAVVLTTATKVAFIGWGLGSATLDFTGISGHAMFAAAIYPLLLAALAPAAPRAWQWLALAVGIVLALMVGVSRLVVDAHSVSEVVAGLVLGGGVGALALVRVPLRARLSPWLAPAAAVWLSLTPAHAPASQSHAIVTRLALTLSGREVPHVRHELHARQRALSDGGSSGGP